MREQRGTILYSLDRFQNKGGGGGGGLDMVCKREVKCLDDYWIRDDGSISIVIGGVNEVFLGEGISRGHPCTWGDLPMDIEVLQ